MRTRCLWSVAAAIVLGGSGFTAQAGPTPKLKVSLDAIPEESPSASPAATQATPTASATPRPALLPVVAFQKLISFLPKPPEGWTAENPAGSQTDLEVFLLSTASRTYQKGDDENAQVATVTIIDAGGHKGYLDAITSQWKATGSTVNSIDKPVQIDDMPGFEHVTAVPKAVSLSVIVGKRFFVQIDLVNLEPKDARDWLKKMDLKGLAALNTEH